MKTNPRIVIGLPVFNGQKYLRAAIESILAQSFGDFQLFIGDNASTDGTPEICQDFVNLDSRVIYHRHDRNMGGAPNHNFVFQPGQADYFKWQAHDDTIEPDYLKRCIALMDADPTLSIVHSRSLVINEAGHCSGTYDHEMRLNGATPSARFWRILWAGYFTEVFGVMRSRMMQKTPLQESFAGSDRNFVASMLLQGDVGYVEEYLFSRRDHDECYCQITDIAAKSQWFDPTVKRSMSKLTGAIKAKAYLSAIATLPMPLTERGRCVQHLLDWMMHRSVESATGGQERHGEQVRDRCAANRQSQEGGDRSPQVVLMGRD